MGYKKLRGEIMNRDYLEMKIKQLSPWYQNINLQGIQTLRKRDTEQAWNRIKENFPMNYEGMRILDLGCNAGYYSIMAANEGASVIGIEGLDRARIILSTPSVIQRLYGRRATTGGSHQRARVL